MTLIKNLLAAAVIALTAGTAQADTYDFTLTGAYSAHWQLNSSPIPNQSQDGVYFELWNVSGTFPGFKDTGFADMGFFSTPQSGGMILVDYYGGNVLKLMADGPQLYSGAENSPTFLTGSFNLVDAAQTGLSGTYSLTISNVSAVPEPESYALLLSGLGAVGFVAARRRKA